MSQAHDSATRERRQYRALFARNRPPARAIEQAIQLLAPGATHAAVANDLLEARARPDTVRDWRRGRYVVPLWAIELLRARLEARARPSLEAITSLERAAPRPHEIGAIGTRALNRWRAQKQKPGV